MQSIKRILSVIALVFLLGQNAIGVEVIMAGVGGNNTRQMLSRLNSDVLSKQPGTVLILAGTNDMLNSGNSVPLAEFESNLKSIVNQISAINSRIVLMTIPPCKEEALLSRHDSAFYAPEGPNGRVAQANEVIYQIAVENNLLLVDMNRIFNRNIDLISSDGVHPTVDGCLVMADSLYQVIDENNLPTEKIVCFGNSITKRYTAYLEKLLLPTVNNPSFEFLFDTEDDTEGWTGFGGGTFSVASGSLTFTYGSATSGFELNPPVTSIGLDKTNFPYLAIKLSETPTVRRFMYCKVGSTGSWYLGKANPPADEALDAVNVFYYDLSGANFPDVTLPDGEITRLIFNLQTDDGSTKVDVDWIKTFASLEDIKAYALSTSVDKLFLREQGNAIKMYPNPVSDMLYLSSTYDFSLQIYNMMGKSVYQTSELKEEHFLDMSGMEDGMYMVLTRQNGDLGEHTLIKN